MQVDVLVFITIFENTCYNYYNPLRGGGPSPWTGTNTEKCPFLVSVHPSKSTEIMSKCLRLEASIVICDWFYSKNYIFISTMFLI